MRDICCSMFQHFELFQVRITFFLYMLVFTYKKYGVRYIIMYLILNLNEIL